MGNSAAKISENDKEQNEEPKLFLQRKITENLMVQILWTKHMGFDFDCLVVPVNAQLFQIERMNRYLFRQLNQKEQEFLLNKTTESGESNFN